MFTFILQLSLGIMAVSTLLYVIRVIKGPTIPDRVVALDGIGINLIAMTALVSILLNTSAFLDIILLLGILSFIGTIAFAKFWRKERLSKMIEIVKWAVAVCILMGSLICLVASFGTLRLPDVYTRAHASSKGSTLGVNLVLLGVLGYLWMLTGEISVKILLGIIFILLTAPVGAHLICRAAYNSGAALDKRSVQDDYKGIRNFVIKRKEDSYL
ncbi:Na(+)/H(+) antiporter subunit (plasmid) [Bacillus velezensis]|nr:Na(+)/H(+) antiporter subunit [Bacillus velezensis]